MRKIVNYTFTVVISFLLFSITLISLTGHYTSDETTIIRQENRRQNSLEMIGWKRNEISLYFKSVEPYLNDRVAFRSILINNYHRINQKTQLKSENDRIIIGKDGWLFLGNTHWNNKMIDQYRGLNKMSVEDLDDWFTYFYGVHKYLESKSIGFYLMFPPDKHRIYPEFLPRELRNKGVNPYDQVHETNQNLNIIDLRPVFDSLKKNHTELLFYKTDTHWNRFAAYFAYREFMKHISSRYELDVIDLTVSDFTFKPAERTFDLPRLAGMDIPPPDIDVFLKVYLSTNEMEVKNDMNELSWRKVHPNTGLGIESNPSARNIDKNKKILIFADSFMSFMVNFMNNTFGEVQYIHHNSTDTLSLEMLVNKHNPDIVLFEVAERNIISSHKDKNTFFVVE